MMLQNRENLLKKYRSGLPDWGRPKPAKSTANEHTKMSLHRKDLVEKNGQEDCCTHQQVGAAVFFHDNRKFAKGAFCCLSGGR